MKDTIKISELKMFLGTGLEYRCIKGTDLNFDKVMITGENLMCEDINMIPYVRPLSELAEEEWLEVFKAGIPEEKHETYIRDLHATIIVGKDKVVLFNGIEKKVKSWNSLITFKKNNFKVHNTCSFDSTKAYNKIAELHGDIFNWLGRGLADRKEGK